MSLATVSALVAVLCVLIYFGLQVQMHRAPTVYAPLRNAVSDYGVGPTARSFRIASLVGTAALLALAAALAGSGVYGWRGGVVAWLLVAAVGRIGVAVFPTDLPQARRTATGRLHLLSAIVQFVALITVVTSDVAGRLGVTGVLAALLHVLGWVAVVSLVGVIVALLLPVARRWFGLVERGFLFSVNAWLGLAAVAVLLRAGS